MVRAQELIRRIGARGRGAVPSSRAPAAVGAALAALLVVAFAGPATAVDALTVAVSPAEAYLRPGEEVRFTAAVADAQGRQVLAPKPGVYFVRVSPTAMPRKVLLVE